MTLGSIQAPTRARVLARARPRALAAALLTFGPGAAAAAGDQPVPAPPAATPSATPAATPSPKAPLKLPAALAVGKIAYEHKNAVLVLDLATGKTENYELPESMEHPDWNPDGKRFAYSSSFGASILDIPGQMFLAVSKPGTPATRPSWSGDGTRLVYETGGDQPAIEVYDTRDKSRKALPLKRLASQPAWHPGADRLAFVAAVEGVDQVFVVDAPCLKDGSCDKPETSLNPVQMTKGGKGSRQPAWSHDGQRLAIARDEGDGKGAGIFVLNADGGGLRRLSPSGSDDHAPAWGSNNALAFQRGGEDPAICVMKADGTGTTTVVDAGRSPSWWQPRP